MMVQRYFVSQTSYADGDSAYDAASRDSTKALAKNNGERHEESNKATVADDMVTSRQP